MDVRGKERGAKAKTAMSRWKGASVVLALLLALAPGCEKQVFLGEKDLNSTVNQLSVALEKDAAAGTHPTIALVQAPPIVDYPSRPPRYLTLSEAVAYALENGSANSNVIGGDALGVGVVDNTLFSNNRGQAALQTDRIKVLALNAAIAYNNIEASESRFDPKWITTMNWAATDQLTNGLNNFNNGETATFNSSIVKALATGGVANITFNTNYTNLSNPPTVGTFKVINPLYNVPVNFGIEQPLLRDFGVGINQLLNQVAPIQGVTMPLQAANYYNNSRLPLTQGPNFTGLPVQGILLARLAFDQSRAEFERQVHNMLLSVEAAYWKLYQAYGNLYAYEEVLRLAHKAWWIGQANYASGRLGPAEFWPIHAQYEEFRGERLKALAGVLEAERNLRGIMGLPPEDGHRLIPVTEPNLARYQPNWQSAQEQALSLRPELVLARQNIKNAQFNLAIQKNFLRPDLRFVGQYTPTGFGTTLDGRGTIVDGTGTLRTANAFGSLAGGDFNNWTVGLTLNVPLGYRLEHAALRSARLGLAQAYYFLQDQEMRATQTLTLHYQKLNEWYRRIEIARAERQAYSESVRSYWELYRAGAAGKQATLTALVLSLLQYQRSLALAQLKEYEAIAEYNNTLARFEWAKGTIMQDDKVVIAEGPLPQCIQTRAVENERQRTKALILNERALPPAPVTKPGLIAGDSHYLPKDLVSPEPGPAPMSVELDKSANPLPAPAMKTNTPAMLPPAKDVEFKSGSVPAPGKLPVLPPTTGKDDISVPLPPESPTSNRESAGGTISNTGSTAAPKNESNAATPPPAATIPPAVGKETAPSAPPAPKSGDMRSETQEAPAKDSTRWHAPTNLNLDEGGLPLLPTTPATPGSSQAAPAWALPQASAAGIHQR